MGGIFSSCIKKPELLAQSRHTDTSNTLNNRKNSLTYYGSTQRVGNKPYRPLNQKFSSNPNFTPRIINSTPSPIRRPTNRNPIFERHLQPAYPGQMRHTKSSLKSAFSPYQKCAPYPTTSLCSSDSELSSLVYNGPLSEHYISPAQSDDESDFLEIC